MGERFRRERGGVDEARASRAWLMWEGKSYAELCCRCMSELAYQVWVHGSSGNVDTRGVLA